MLISLALALGLLPSVGHRPAVVEKLHQLKRAIGRRDAEPSKVIGACLDVCHALPGPRGAEALPEDVEMLREAAAFFDFAKDGDRIGQHLFDVDLWDDVTDTLARAVSSSQPDASASLTREASAAVAASAQFILAEDAVRAEAVATLEALVSSKGFLAARREALAAIRQRRQTDAQQPEQRRPRYADPEAALAAARERRRKQDYVAVAATTDDDTRIILALYDCSLASLGPSLLAPLGFPATRLGLRCFIGANRYCGSQRAAAAMGTIWHASSERGPLIMAPLTSSPLTAIPAARSRLTPQGGGKRLRSDGSQQRPNTLVVVFSSLGWNGVVRAEWGATLRAVGDESSFVVAHALDTSQSWFQTDPHTGEYDDGRWWDARLGSLCAGFERVCMLGESMGASGALRFARHATESVVALVPQIDVRDFEYSGRADFGDERKERLRASIQEACARTSAKRLVLHVGQDPPDLRQLSYLDPLLESEDGEGSGGGSARDLQPRLRVIRHAVPGHALGAGLKQRGLLRRTVLRDLLGHSYELPAAGESTASAAGPHT
jgi:predicted ArsR family transcriptional regulator